MTEYFTNDVYTSIVIFLGMPLLFIEVLLFSYAPHIVKFYCTPSTREERDAARKKELDNLENLSDSEQAKELLKNLALLGGGIALAGQALYWLIWCILLVFTPYSSVSIGLLLYIFLGAYLMQKNLHKKVWYRRVDAVLHITLLVALSIYHFQG